jgi:hypothetical protein
MAIKVVKHDKKQTKKTSSKTKKEQGSKENLNLPHACNCHCGGGEARADQHALVY